MQKLTRRALIGTAGLCSGVLLGTGVSAMLVREARKPAISLLGSGESLSVLVSSERATVAVLFGTDPADFGNALRKARVPLFTRTDIAIVPEPGSTGSTFLRSALSQLGESQVIAVGDSTPMLDAGIAVDDVINGEASFALPGDIQIDLIASEPWRANIVSEFGRVVLSHGAFDPNLVDDFPVAVWAHLGGTLPEPAALRLVKPASICMPASAMSLAEALVLFPSSADWSPEINRVHAGEANRILLEEIANV